MYRENKYDIFLKKDITNAILIEKGFTIKRERNTKWATRNEEDVKKMLIIKLDPPQRRLMFRYQSSDIKYDILEEIQDIMDLFDIKKND